MNPGNIQDDLSKVWFDDPNIGEGHVHHQDETITYVAENDQGSWPVVALSIIFELLLLGSVSCQSITVLRRHNWDRDSYQPRRPNNKSSCILYKQRKVRDINVILGLSQCGPLVLNYILVLDDYGLGNSRIMETFQNSIDNEIFILKIYIQKCSYCRGSCILIIVTCTCL